MPFHSARPPGYLVKLRQSRNTTEHPEHCQDSVGCPPARMYSPRTLYGQDSEVSLAVPATCAQRGRELSNLDAQTTPYQPAEDVLDDVNGRVPDLFLDDACCFCPPLLIAR